MADERLILGIDLNTSEAEKKLQSLHAKIENAPSTKFKVDARTLKKTIDDISSRLSKIAEVTVKFEADMSPVDTVIKSIRGKLDRLVARDSTVVIEADGSSASKAIAQVKADLDSLQSSVAVSIQVNNTEALNAISSLQDGVKILSEMNTVTIGADGAAAFSLIQSLQAEVESLTSLKSISIAADSAAVRESIASIQASLDSVASNVTVQANVDIAAANQKVSELRRDLEDLASLATVRFKATIGNTNQTIKSITEKLEKLQNSAKVKLEADVSDFRQAINDASSALGAIDLTKSVQLGVESSEAERLVDSLRANLAALDSTVSISVSVDVESAHQAIDGLKTNLGTLRDEVAIGLRVESAGVTEALSQVATSLESLDNQNNVQVSVNAGNSLSVIEAIKSSLSELSNSPLVAINFETDRSAVDTAIKSIRGKLDRLVARDSTLIIEADAQSASNVIAQIKADLDSIKNSVAVNFQVDTTEAESAISRLQENVKSLSGLSTITIEANGSSALSLVESLKAEVDNLTNLRSINIAADSSAVTSAIANLQESLNSVSSSVEIQADVNTELAARKIAELRGDLESLADITTVKFKATVGNTNQTIKAIGEKLERLQESAKIKIEADVNDFRQAINDASTSLESLDLTKSVQLAADTDEAQRLINSVKGNLSELDSTVNVSVNVDVESAHRSIDGLKTNLDSLEREVSLALSIDSAGVAAAIDQVAEGVKSLQTLTTVGIAADSGDSFNTIESLKSSLSDLSQLRSIAISTQTGNSIQEINQLSESLGSLPDTTTVNLNVNAGASHAIVDGLRTNLAELPDTSQVRIQIEAAGALESIKSVRKALDELVDVSGAGASLNGIERQLRELNEAAHIDLTISADSVNDLVSDLQSKIDNFAKGIDIPLNAVITTQDLQERIEVYAIPPKTSEQVRAIENAAQSNVKTEMSGAYLESVEKSVRKFNTQAGRAGQPKLEEYLKELIDIQKTIDDSANPEAIDGKLTENIQKAFDRVTSNLRERFEVDAEIDDPEVVDMAKYTNPANIAPLDTTTLEDRLEVLSKNIANLISFDTGYDVPDTKVTGDLDYIPLANGIAFDGAIELSPQRAEALTGDGAVPRDALRTLIHELRHRQQHNAQAKGVDFPFITSPENKREKAEFDIVARQYGNASESSKQKEVDAFIFAERFVDSIADSLGIALERNPIKPSKFEELITIVETINKAQKALDDPDFSPAKKKVIESQLPRARKRVDDYFEAFGMPELPEDLRELDPEPYVERLGSLKDRALANRAKKQATSEEVAEIAMKVLAEINLEIDDNALGNEIDPRIGVNSVPNDAENSEVLSSFETLIETIRENQGDGASRSDLFAAFEEAVQRGDEIQAIKAYQSWLEQNAQPPQSLIDEESALQEQLAAMEAGQGAPTSEDLINNSRVIAENIEAQEDATEELARYYQWLQANENTQQTEDIEPTGGDEEAYIDRMLELHRGENLPTSEELVANAAQTAEELDARDSAAEVARAEMEYAEFLENRMRVLEGEVIDGVEYGSSSVEPPDVLDDLDFSALDEADAILPDSESIDESTQSLSDMLDELENMGNPIGGVIRGFRQMFKLVQSFSAPAGFVAIASMLGAMVASAAPAVQAFQQLEKVLDGLDVGDSIQGIALASDLAVEFGVNLEDTARQLASFSAATVDTNLEADARRIFESLATYGSVLGSTQDELNRGFVALEQIAAKGRVSLEELNGQLSEAIPGVSNLAARALGVTRAEMFAMAEAGDLLAIDLLPKLATELENTTGAAAALGSTTLAQEFSKINQSIKLANVKATQPIIEGVTDALRALNKLLSQSPMFAEMVTTAFTALTVAAGGLAIASLTLLAPAITAVTASLTAGLIAIAPMAAAIAAVTAAMLALKEVLVDTNLSDFLPDSSKKVEKQADAIKALALEVDKLIKKQRELNGLDNSNNIGSSKLTAQENVEAKENLTSFFGQLNFGLRRAVEDLTQPLEDESRAIVNIIADALAEGFDKSKLEEKLEDLGDSLDAEKVERLDEVQNSMVALFQQMNDRKSGIFSPEIQQQVRQRKELEDQRSQLNAASFIVKREAENLEPGGDLVAEIKSAFSEVGLSDLVDLTTVKSLDQALEAVSQAQSRVTNSLNSMDSEVLNAGSIMEGFVAQLNDIEFTGNPQAEERRIRLIEMLNEEIILHRQAVGKTTDSYINLTKRIERQTALREVQESAIGSIGNKLRLTVEAQGLNSGIVGNDAMAAQMTRIDMMENRANARLLTERTLQSRSNVQALSQKDRDSVSRVSGGTSIDELNQEQIVDLLANAESAQLSNSVQAVLTELNEVMEANSTTGIDLEREYVQLQRDAQAAAQGVEEEREKALADFADKQNALDDALANASEKLSEGLNDFTKDLERSVIRLQSELDSLTLGNAVKEFQNSLLKSVGALEGSILGDAFEEAVNLVLDSEVAGGESEASLLLEEMEIAEQFEDGVEQLDSIFDAYLDEFAKFQEGLKNLNEQRAELAKQDREEAILKGLVDKIEDQFRKAEAGEGLVQTNNNPLSELNLKLNEQLQYSGEVDEDLERSLSLLKKRTESLAVATETGESEMSGLSDAATQTAQDLEALSDAASQPMGGDNSSVLSVLIEIRDCLKEYKAEMGGMASSAGTSEFDLAFAVNRLASVDEDIQSAKDQIVSRTSRDSQDIAVSMLVDQLNQAKKLDAEALDALAKLKAAGLADPSATIERGDRSTNLGNGQRVVLSDSGYAVANERQSAQRSYSQEVLSGKRMDMFKAFNNFGIRGDSTSFSAKSEEYLRQLAEKVGTDYIPRADLTPDGVESSDQLLRNVNRASQERELRKSLGISSNNTPLNLDSPVSPNVANLPAGVNGDEAISLLERQRDIRTEIIAQKRLSIELDQQAATTQAEVAVAIAQREFAKFIDDQTKELEQITLDVSGSQFDVFFEEFQASARKSLESAISFYEGLEVETLKARQKIMAIDAELASSGLSDERLNFLTEQRDLLLATLDNTNALVDAAKTQVDLAQAQFDAEAKINKVLAERKADSENRQSLAARASEDLDRYLSDPYNQSVLSNDDRIDQKRFEQQSTFDDRVIEEAKLINENKFGGNNIQQALIEAEIRIKEIDEADLATFKGQLNTAGNKLRDSFGDAFSSILSIDFSDTQQSLSQKLLGVLQSTLNDLQSWAATTIKDGIMDMLFGRSKSGEDKASIELAEQAQGTVREIASQSNDALADVTDSTIEAETQAADKMAEARKSNAAKLGGVGLGAATAVGGAVTGSTEAILGGVGMMVGSYFGGAAGGAAGGAIGSLLGGLFYDGTMGSTGKSNMSIEEALIKERSMTGQKPYLAVLSDKEHVLSARNGDAQAYEKMKKSGIWDTIAANVPNFADGTMEKLTTGSTVSNNSETNKTTQVEQINNFTLLVESDQVVDRTAKEANEKMRRLGLA